MIKGQTTIELTDITTKQTEVFQKNNLVTNAVSDIFSYNPSALLYPLQGGTTGMNREIFPIANTCYSGILLFEDFLVEDVKEYIPPVDNKIIGYASNDVNQTENANRGSLNLSESTIIENGYKYVWDFSTSQANGLISSLALTHYRAGKSYYGDSHSADNSAILLNRMSQTLDSETMALYVCMVEAELTNNVFTSIIPNADKTIDIVRVKEPLTSLGLNDPIINISPQTLEKVTLNVDEFYQGISTIQYPNFFDGEDGYWYGFIRHSDTQKNKTKLNRLKIKKTDYSITIDHWELEGILIHNLGNYFRNNNGFLTRSINSLLYKKFLYIFSSESEIIYKINISNPVDVTSIELGFKSSYASGDNTRNYLYRWGEYICGYDFVIDQKDRVTKTAGYGLPYIATPLIEFGPFRLGYYVVTSYSSATLYKTLYLHSPYLGTINNLATPILKTADKTMKITYILTEVEESV